MSLKRPIKSTQCGRNLGAVNALFAIANGEVA
jgi:hypothetical protein